jgi:hypothetical protein
MYKPSWLHFTLAIERERSSWERKKEKLKRRRKRLEI